MDCFRRAALCRPKRSVPLKPPKNTTTKNGPTPKCACVHTRTNPSFYDSLSLSLSLSTNQPMKSDHANVHGMGAGFGGSMEVSQAACLKHCEVQIKLLRRAGLGPSRRGDWARLAESGLLYTVSQSHAGLLRSLPTSLPPSLPIYLPSLKSTPILWSRVA